MDIIPDGEAPEAPPGSTDDAYLGIPADFGRSMSVQVGERVEQLGRVTAQGAYEGAGWLPRLLYGMGAASSEGQLPMEPIKSPMVDPDQYNEAYAPIGNDGKLVPLGDKPMPQAIAQLIGEAKRKEIERNNVLSRFESAHSWPVNLGASIVGFMLDPINAATAFVPAIGEEALLAQFGTGLAARVGARLGAGAAAGALSQAPLSALQYGLGQQEAGDYDLRSAFRDMLFGAAGNALFHAGITGPLAAMAERRSRLAMAREAIGRAEETPEDRDEVGRWIDEISKANAATQYARTSAAVGEMVEGKPVDVEPFVDPVPKPIDIAAQQRAQDRVGYAPGVAPEDLKRTTDEVYGQEPGTQRTTIDINGERTVVEGPTRPPAPTKPPDDWLAPEEPKVAEGETPTPEAPRGTAPQQEPGGMFAAMEAENPDLFAAEQAFAGIDRDQLLPEEREAVAASEIGIREAVDKEDALREAGICLKDAGL